MLRRAPSKCVWERVPIVERCPGARQRSSTAKASTSKRPIRDATTRVPEGTRPSRVRELETAASRFGVPAMASSLRGQVALSGGLCDPSPVVVTVVGGGLVQPG